MTSLRAPGARIATSASSAEIGFMQGRLSPLIDGKIQAFPWPYWQDEFPLAERLGFPLMEWTLDQDRLHENPLMTSEGRAEIRSLMARHGVRVLSCTGDCFMQAPFYKAQGRERQSRLDDLGRVIESCADLGVAYLVMPLEDNGRLEDDRQEEALIEGLEQVREILQDMQGCLLFESDYPPTRLASFINRLAPELFGINYDIGNSASRGYRVAEEVAAYGGRILNVHVKDRLRGGGTVPLGQGSADIPGVLQALKGAGYRGAYILQTARAGNGYHAEALCQYRDLVAQWLRGIKDHGPRT